MPPDEVGNIGRLVQWCCHHAIAFAEQFLKFFPEMLRGADPSHKAILAEEAGRLISCSDDLYTLENCVARLDSAFLPNARSSATVEDLTLLYEAVAKEITPDSRWVIPHVTKLISKRPIGSPEMTFCRRVLERLSPALALEVFNEIVGNIATAVAHRVHVDAFLSKIVRLFIDVHREAIPTFGGVLSFDEQELSCAFSPTDGDFVIRAFFNRHD
jgi:hypothetical protein